jgi:hypothetical protein
MSRPVSEMTEGDYIITCIGRIETRARYTDLSKGAKIGIIGLFDMKIKMYLHPLSHQSATAGYYIDIDHTRNRVLECIAATLSSDNPKYTNIDGVIETFRSGYNPWWIVGERFTFKKYQPSLAADSADVNYHQTIEGEEYTIEEIKSEAA